MHSLAFHFSYVKHWRTLGAIWVLFAVSVAVLQFLVLLHPAWIGSDEGGYFGLYDFCPAIECTWSPFKVRPLSFASDIAAFLVLSATVLSMLAVFAIMLLVLLRDRYVFLLSSWMHLFAFAAMLGACCIYPYGWDHPRVREICESQTYKLGLCRLRWPYMLAFVLIVDQLTLSLLGFVLGCRTPPSYPSYPETAFAVVSSKPHISRPIPIPHARKKSLGLRDSEFAKTAVYPQVTYPMLKKGGRPARPMESAH